MKVAVGHGTGTSSREKGEVGIVGEQDGWRVGGGAGVDDVATKSTSILVSDAAGPTRGFAQDREFACDHRMFTYIGKSSSCSNDDGVGRGFDETEFFEAPERDELLGAETTCGQSDHEFGAPCDRGVPVR